MKKIAGIFPVLLVNSLIVLASCNSFQADIILINGKIFTSDTAQLYVEAIAIKGNKIIASGDNAEIKKLASSATKRIDLKRRTVVPGFNDAHDHLGFEVPMKNFFVVDFSLPGPERTTIVDSLATILKRVKPNQWIGGKIGLNALWDPDMKRVLDSIAPSNPVALQIWWGHGIILNSKALTMMGIADDAPDPLGGWYGRKSGTQQINGVLYEYAQWPVWPKIYTSYRDEQLKGVRDYCSTQVSMGITSIQNFSSLFSPEETSHFFMEADVPQRIRIVPFPGTNKHGRKLAEWDRLNENPAPRVRVSGMKYLIDGTPLEQTSLLTRPYHGDWYGRLNMPVDTIRQILKEAYQGDAQLMMHIVGDSAMSIVLKLMKETGTEKVWQKKRVRFEHNQSAGATPADIQAIREMGVLMAHTPWVGHNSHLASFINQGITVSISPDGTLNPFADMMVMVNQQKNPEENISIEQAVIAYTKTNAFAEFMEKEKGTLMPGMLADLAVLSQDIFTIPADQLPATRSVLTMIDGEIVYKTEELTLK